MQLADGGLRAALSGAGPLTAHNRPGPLAGLGHRDWGHASAGSVANLQQLLATFHPDCLCSHPPIITTPTRPP
jgi:hypothetical protein